MPLTFDDEAWQKMKKGKVRELLKTLINVIGFFLCWLFAVFVAVSVTAYATPGMYWSMRDAFPQLNHHIKSLVSAQTLLDFYKQHPTSSRQINTDIIKKVVIVRCKQSTTLEHGSVTSCLTKVKIVFNDDTRWYTKRYRFAQGANGWAMISKPKT